MPKEKEKEKMSHAQNGVSPQEYMDHIPNGSDVEVFESSDQDIGHEEYVVNINKEESPSFLEEDFAASYQDIGHEEYAVCKKKEPPFFLKEEFEARNQDIGHGEYVDSEIEKKSSSFLHFESSDDDIEDEDYVASENEEQSSSSSKSDTGNVRYRKGASRATTKRAIRRGVPGRGPKHTASSTATCDPTDLNWTINRGLNRRGEEILSTLHLRPTHSTAKVKRIGARQSGFNSHLNARQWEWWSGFSMKMASRVTPIVQGKQERSGLSITSQYRARGSWNIGDPLREVWSTDEDVPIELASLIEGPREDRNEGGKNRSDRGDDSEDDVFDDSDRINSNFKWSPMESFQPKEEIFIPKVTGSVQTYDSAYDAFRSYWDDNILRLIVKETNLYATKISSKCFQSDWFPTNTDEILCLFAFWMMLGVVKMPTIVSCFSSDPLLKTDVFRRIFTKTRYERLTRALNYIDSTVNYVSNPSHSYAAKTSDRLHHFRSIISHLNSKFQSNYVLDRDICIDESLTLWKGTLNIKQYNRMKAAKSGIKTYELCESSTGYMWSFIVHTGKDTSDVELSPAQLKSTGIVKKLIEPLLNKGYRLFMNSWYNSPLLARFLKLNGTDCVGALRPSCRNIPGLISKAPLRRGEIVARHSGDVSVLSWQDKNRVTMISTCHGSFTALPKVLSKPFRRPVPFKPQVVLDFNKFMGGVDLKDEMLEPYLIERKRCCRWQMKLFKRLVNVSILNARVLLQSSKQKQFTHLNFCLDLVDSILTKHLSNCPVSRKFNVSRGGSAKLQPGRIVPVVHQHWPTLLEQPENFDGNIRRFRKRCIVCLREGRKWHKTTFRCETCDVPLCIEKCFKIYHTST